MDCSIRAISAPDLYVLTEADTAEAAVARARDALETIRIETLP